MNEQFLLNVEYKFGGQEFATLSKKETKEDVSVHLLTEGYAMVEKRKEKRLQKMLATYRKAQESARQKRVSILRS